MKYGRFVFVTATLMLAACAAQKQSGFIPTGPVAIGNFRQELRLSSVHYKGFLEIGVDSVTARSVCKDAGRVTTVTVTSPAVISGSHIDIKESLKKTVSQPGGGLCVAQLTAGVVVYDLAYGDELTLTPVGGESFFFGYRAGHRPELAERIKRAKNRMFKSAADLSEDIVNSEAALHVYSKDSDFKRRLDNGRRASLAWTSGAVDWTVDGVKNVYDGAMKNASENIDGIKATANALVEAAQSAPEAQAPMVTNLQ